MLVVMGLHPVLAKATVLQEIDIPGYTRADGTYVPPHRQHVHVNPDVDQHAVLNGWGSHSQRLALRRLQKKSGLAGSMGGSTGITSSQKKSGSTSINTVCLMS